MVLVGNHSHFYALSGCALCVGLEPACQLWKVVDGQHMTYLILDDSKVCLLYL